MLCERDCVTTSLKEEGYGIRSSHLYKSSVFHVVVGDVEGGVCDVEVCPGAGDEEVVEEDEGGGGSD